MVLQNTTERRLFVHMVYICTLENEGAGNQVEGARGKGEQDPKCYHRRPCPVRGGLIHVCVCVCVCVIYIYIYIYIHSHTHVYTYIHIYIHIYKTCIYSESHHGRPIRVRGGLYTSQDPIQRCV